MDTSIFKKIGINDFKLKLIKSDASFRKYFRVYIKNQKQNLLFVNSPKKTENNSENNNFITNNDTKFK